MLSPGDPAPWFNVRSTVNPLFQFDSIGGRHVAVCFFGSAAGQEARAALGMLAANPFVFDGENTAFVGVSTDPEDEATGRVQQTWPHALFFWDFDRTVSRAFQVAGTDGHAYQPQTVILDPQLRVLAVIPFGDDGAAHMLAVQQHIAALPPVTADKGFAPVLVVPRIFEPEFCRRLIDLYEANGGRESGFMRDVEGKTVAVQDYSHKRRSDYDITDQQLIRECQLRLHRRLVPEIKKVFQFTATRIERHIVACYDATVGGHFNRHRDNTTKGTAHRRFAVSINLNAEEFEGGDLCFAEYGLRSYRPPTGGAVVFACSLLHQALPVTRGRRYAFLPFLYDDEAARIRQANLHYLQGT